MQIFKSLLFGRQLNGNKKYIKGNTLSGLFLKHHVFLRFLDTNFNTYKQLSVLKKLQNLHWLSYISKCYFFNKCLGLYVQVHP